MRLRSLQISGFRGFAGHERFDLDASVVVLVGANGQGKTSFFDAILWALTGKVQRLGDDDRALVSLYSPSGEARVEVTLSDSSNNVVSITRHFDGQQHNVIFERGGESVRGPSAESRILGTLWPASAATQDPQQALGAALTRSVYLQQDLVREFVEADDEKARFAVVSELCGAGRVTELQSQLERSRNAWSRTSTETDTEVEELATRLATLDAQLERLQEGPALDEAARSAWDDWWRRAGTAHGEAIGELPELGGADAASRLDSAVNRIRQALQAAERLRDEIEILRAEIQGRQGTDAPDLEAMGTQLSTLTSRVEEARASLAQARERAAETRRRQVQERERNQELAVLAQIARRHLADRCPVCDQEFDRAGVEAHLEARIARGGEEQPDEGALGQDVDSLARALEQAERALAELQQRLQRAQATERELGLWERDRDRRLTELGVELGAEAELLSSIDARLRRESERCAELGRRQEQGEGLSLALARAGESARRSEVSQQAARVRQSLARAKGAQRDRQRTYDLASRIIDQLREASLDVVQEQIDQIAPLLERIYATADPHPAFRSVRLLSRIFRGKGHLSAAIDDLVDDKSSRTPELVLSSSQMNALAVSIFLALNLGVPSVPISTAMLDDPLQSLDDVNLLGLIDLLRRLTDRRQLIVSTHDERFGRLLERKLRPIAEGQRTRVIKFKGWAREGPRVEQHEIERDPQALRIVAA